MAGLEGIVKKCIVCGRAYWLPKFEYNAPDKYEGWQNIKIVKRAWVKCTRCGVYRQVRNYSMKRLERIYVTGYRNPVFRGETIEDAFDRISSYPYATSENKQRYDWYKSKCEAKNVLDIGSGIGVWPWLLKEDGVNVTCTEENKYSRKFISETLGIPCYESLEDIYGKFNNITLLHVLEHIEDPHKFLKDLHRFMYVNDSENSDSWLFIEVPDDMEFEYLDKDHDEFNSCHVYFYSMSSLYKTLERSGFRVLDMHREHYEKRNLTRIMATAKLK